MDKYIPLEKLTRKEKGFYYKPWLSKGIKASMKTRDYLKKKAIKDRTEEAEKYYKKFKNFVNRLQNIAYNNYYSNKVNKNFKNKKRLWETVGEITKYKKKKHTEIKKIECDGKELTQFHDISNCLNDYFNLIGKKCPIALKIPIRVTILT